MRINRFLAACGLGSRRKMDELIASGRIRINGNPLDGPGQPVMPGRDVVTLDGSVLALPDEQGVWMLHKPVGFLTTMSDPQGRPTVAEFVDCLPVRVFPVGRLDMDTSGLLLFTNDGKLAHRLAHPKHGVEKEYRVIVRGRLTHEAKAALEEGVLLEEGVTSPARVLERAAVFPEKNLQNGEDVFHLIIHEGWKRQVRRMCDAVGLPVIQLARVRYDFLRLDGLAPGGLRRLPADEVARLQAGTAQRVRGRA
ncbi:MAG TPA: pseudouridine synthase [Spirochaetota bacterium]|nr:pseudouridine synthase [Spirochaetota bacterium]